MRDAGLAAETMRTTGHLEPTAIEDWQSFWKGKPAGQPLVGTWVASYYPLKTFTEGRAETQVLPHHLTVQAALDDMHRARVSRRVSGDAVWVASPPSGIPWLEAIMGCPVKASSGAAWSERPAGDWRTFDLAWVPWENGWLAKMNEITRALIQAAGGQVPIGPCHIRGPSEAVAAILGYQEMAYSIYDHPEELHRLLGVCTSVWLEIVRSQYGLLPSHAAGYYYPSVPLWAPGRTMAMTADVAAMLSPAMFDRFLLPYIEQATGSVEYCWMHLHSTYLHIVESLLQLDSLRAIQVTVDHAGPSVEELLPPFRKIQSYKPLIVSGSLSATEMSCLMKSLSPTSLYVLSLVDSVEVGDQLLDSLSDE